MTYNETKTSASKQLTLSPPARRPYGRQLRFLWGQGVFSGLPLGEFVLMAAFLASASMVLTANDSDPLAKSSHPLETQAVHTFY